MIAENLWVWHHWSRMIHWIAWEVPWWVLVRRKVMWWNHGLLRWKLIFPYAGTAEATCFHFFLSDRNAATDTAAASTLCFHNRLALRRVDVCTAYSFYYFSTKLLATICEFGSLLSFHGR